MTWGGYNKQQAELVVYHEADRQYTQLERCSTQPSETDCQADRAAAWDRMEAATKLASDDDHEISSGVLMIVVTLVLWPLFYLLRWILTGKVRANKESIAR